MSDNQVTAREFDLLRQMVQEGFDGTHQRLDAIDEKQRIANGRTSTLEGEWKAVIERLRALERDMKRLVSRRIVTDSGESLSASVKISPAMWKALAAVGGALGALVLPRLAEWLGKLGGS